MTRRRYAVATAIAASLFATGYIAVAAVDPLPRLVWNASASAPIGLYRVQPDRDLPVGALVAVTPPAPLSRWLAMRRYLPEGVPLLKHVAAKPGARVCRIGARVSIDARPVVIARSHDRFGRSLPVWQGCRTLKPGELFLLNAGHPDSLDGRYFGPLPGHAVLGRARPILTRDAPGAPLVWRLGQH
ncbi:S26 family signal peptidase [Sphingomonas aquatilis]